MSHVDPNDSTAHAAPRIGAELRFVVILGVTALGLALRLFRLGGQSLWIDEILMIQRASLGEPFRFADWFVNPQGPLPALLLRLAAQFFGTSEVALRLPSALAGALSVPVIGALGRRFHPRAHLPALLLAAISPFLIWYSQEARHYALAILGASLAHLTFLRFLDDPRTGRMAAYAASVWLGLMSNLTVIFLVLAHGAALLGKPRAARGKWLAAVLPAFLLLAPWFWVAVSRNVNLQHVASVTPVPVAERLRGESTFSWWGIPYTGFVFFGGYSLGPSLVELHDAPQIRTVLPHLGLVAPLLLGALSLLGAGLYARTTTPWMRGLVLLSVAIPLVAVLLLAWRNAKVFNPRYASVALPLVLAATAAGFQELRQRARPAAYLAAALLFLPMTVSTYNYFFDRRYAREDMRGAAGVLRAEAKADDLVLGVGAPQVLDWYYHGPAPVEIVYDVWIRDPVGLTQRISQWADGRRRLWLCVSRPWLQDPDRKLEQLLDARFPLHRRHVFSGVVLTEYAVPR